MDVYDERTFTIGNKKPQVHNKSTTSLKSIKKQEEEDETGMPAKQQTFTAKMIEDLKNARNIKGLSQSELAKKLNIQTSVIQDLERNVLPYNKKLYNTIMRILGVNIHKSSIQ